MYIFLSDEVESITDEIQIRIRYNKDSSQLAFSEQYVKIPSYLLMAPVSEGLSNCEFNYKVNISMNCDQSSISNLYEYIAEIYKSP